MSLSLSIPTRFLSRSFGSGQHTRQCVVVAKCNELVKKKGASREEKTKTTDRILCCPRTSLICGYFFFVSMDRHLKSFCSDSSSLMAFSWSATDDATGGRRWAMPTKDATSSPGTGESSPRGGRQNTNERLFRENRVAATAFLLRTNACKQTPAADTATIFITS